MAAQQNLRLLCLVLVRAGLPVSARLRQPWGANSRLHAVRLLHRCGCSRHFTPFQVSGRGIVPTAPTLLASGYACRRGGAPLLQHNAARGASCLHGVG